MFTNSIKYNLTKIFGLKDQSTKYLFRINSVLQPFQEWIKNTYINGINPEQLKEYKLTYIKEVSKITKNDRKKRFDEVLTNQTIDASVLGYANQALRELARYIVSGFYIDRTRSVCLIETPYKGELLDLFTQLAQKKLIYATTVYSNEANFSAQLLEFYDIIILVITEDDVLLPKSQIQALIRGNAIKCVTLQNNEIIEFRRQTPLIILTSSLPEWLGNCIYTDYDDQRRLMTLSHFLLLKLSIEELDLLTFHQYFIQNEAFISLLLEEALLNARSLDN